MEIALVDGCRADEDRGTLDDRFDGSDTVVTSAPPCEVPAPAGCDPPAAEATPDGDDDSKSRDSCRTTATDDLVVTCWSDDVTDGFPVETLLVELFVSLTGGLEPTVGTLVGIGFLDC